MQALECVEKESRQDYLLKYLTLKLAPVLVKVKPSMLVALCNCGKSARENYYDLWKEQKGNISMELKISFKELKDTSCTKQVLFYNPQALFDTITQPEKSVFLKGFGYVSRGSLEDYLGLLKERFCAYGASASGSGEKGSSFPHEIGVFLGYPLKDVKGFIERGSVPLTSMGRWQVFGESGQSIQLMQMHRKAEKVFLSFMENRRNPIPYMERVSGHFRKFANDTTTVQVS